MTTQTTNLPITNPKDDVDLRVNEYFTQYFKNPQQISPNEYDQLKNFFYERTKNIQATAALTAAVIDASEVTGVFITDILQEIKSTTNLQETTAAYLNLSRRGSSLLGISRGLNTPNETKRQIRI